VTKTPEIKTFDTLRDEKRKNTLRINFSAAC